MEKRKVTLWIHTTCGVEFEIRDALTEKVLYDRWFVVDEDNEARDEIEDREREFVKRRCGELGLELVGEAWS
jgi:hypothetical protein